MVKILIVDDFPVVRKGLREVLEEKGGFTHIDEADDGRRALELIRENKYGAVLLDINMPGKSGLNVLSDIKKVKPDMPVLMVSMHPEEDYAVRALKAGASGYVTKTAKPSDFVEAVTRVVSGRKYVSEHLAENMAMLMDQEKGELPHQQLSDREFEVFCKLASGYSVSEIAEELSLSAKTISTYRARILEKMNIESNAELAIYAVKNNLISS